jgi:hypothetical protein
MPAVSGLETASFPSRRAMSPQTAEKNLHQINAVFGAEQPVQRCRAHKLRNVLG